MRIAAERGARRVGRVASGLVLAATSLAFATLDAPGDERNLARALEARKSITAKDVAAHLAAVASPELEGRDSPSAGLSAAAEYLTAALEAAGYENVPGSDGLRRSYTRALPVPAPERCRVAPAEAGPTPELGVDFVPLPGCVGTAEGETVFAGFGITDKKARFDEIAPRDLKGRVAVVLEGEPRHARLFEGPDVLTQAGDVYAKVERLLDAGAVGVVVVRRAPAKPSPGPDGAPLPPPALGFRYTWADWNPATTDPLPRQRRGFKSPVVEVTRELATRLLGVDPEGLAERIEGRGKPLTDPPKGPRVRLETAFENRSVPIDNVVGVLRGIDPSLADQYVVIGAHYDHIGVDPWGRVGCGADDNASGTAAMLEVAQALAQERPRRSVMVCFFASEEDGLLGSRAFADALPVPKESLVAMLNMDMVGRGEEKEVVALGTRQNPDLDKVLEEALDWKGTAVKDVVTNRAEHLWQRSDHYSFHAIGVPVLFFFEAVSEDLNRDYHTFRDTVESLNVPKVVNTAQLCYQVAWILANEDGRPAAPRER